LSASKPPPPPDGADGAERRSATRYAAQLDARLLFQLSVAPVPAGAGEHEGGAHANAHTPASTLRLVGHTRNISETGLAFIVPTLRIGDQFAHVIGSRLRITLYLPSGHVEIRAMPVRYERLPPEDAERGYLIGVRIAEMADDEWVRVVEYVRSLR
jgi:hypothetical protein